MFGEGIGNLSVSTRTAKLEPVLKWKEKGSQGDLWIRGFFNTKEQFEFVVIFEGN
jgi:hypothetical protein